MKKTLLFFCALLLAFLGTWAFKAKSPLGRPDAYAYGVDQQDGAWWLARDTKPPTEDGWTLDPELPLNYIPVLSEEETYMVIGPDGKIEGYRHRTKQEDGSWVWEDVNPDIPEQYEAVEGLENVYKVTDSQGNVKYVKYVRNDDDTFYFIDVDENGQEIQKEPQDGKVIPDNYRRVRGNVYAVYNDHGVVVGYRERILNEDGLYQWIDCEKPQEPAPESPDPVNPNSNTRPEGGQPSQDVPKDDIVVGNPGVVQKPVSGGGYEETETIIETKVQGGWRITYQTIVVRVYDANGKLLSTRKDGPNEIGKVHDGTGGQALDLSRIESTLDGEYSRVTNGLSIRSDLAGEVVALLNAERTAAGLPPVTMAQSSTVYKLAALKAADMAVYDHADFDSPMYGTIGDLLGRYQISSSAPSETLWKTTASKAAKDIHIRFQAQTFSRQARMNQQYSEVGIGIVEKNGYYRDC